MAEKEEKPQMSSDVLKANQGIAAQAALKAQQIMFRHKLAAVAISGENSTTSAAAALKKSAPPAVPARGDSVLTKKPPEVPPKRNSLKKPVDGEEGASKEPPPLPKKPGSAQNSPLATPKHKDKPIRPVPPTPQMANKFERPPASLPQPTIASTNPFANLRNSPQLNQRPNQPSANNSPQLSSAARSVTTSSSSASSKNTTPTPAKKQISPIEDFSSEDALRGIESGLRNMERAMAEQMSIRSMEAAAQAKNDKRNFNPMEFKRNIGGSANSLDGSGNNVATAQNMSVIESMRMALNKNLRSMERGFSMDQMRLDQMQLNNSMRNFEANSNQSNGVQRPFENHMKSLDRNLPLELQYSRHNRSQSQQDSVEQLRQNLVNAAGGPPISAAPNGTGLSRDDIRLRRRSSHDENQTQAQNNNNNPGKMVSWQQELLVSFANSSVLLFTHFPIDYFFCEFITCLNTYFNLFVCLQLIDYVSIGTKHRKMYYRENRS